MLQSVYPEKKGAACEKHTYVAQKYTIYGLCSEN